MTRFHVLIRCSMLTCALGVLSILAWGQGAAPLPTVVRYMFHLSLSDTSQIIIGRADITLQSNRPASDSLYMDLEAPDRIGGMHVTAVTCNQIPVRYAQYGQTLAIGPPDSGFPKKNFTLIIHYFGIPKDGLIISSNKFGERTFFGDNWPDRAHQWLPLFDVPYIKAPVDFFITAPDHDQVIANGHLVNLIPGSGHVIMSHWHESIPIAPKIMVMAAAPFAVSLLGKAHDGVPVETWVYPQDTLAGKVDFRRAIPILNYFETLLGPFPFEKCAHVESTTRYGGMENASNIFYDEKEINGSGRIEGTMAHELAHQWFGDWVTEKDWHHIWLSEGLASFMETVYTGRFWGKDSLRNELMRDQQIVFGYSLRHPGSIVDSSIHNLNNLLNPYTYQKASLMLRSLEQRIGNPAFWNGLKLYIKRYKTGCALSADFERCMEESSHQHLQTFFYQWLYRKDFPILTCRWSYHPQEHKIKVTLQQLQHGSPFHLHSRICMQYGSGKITTRILDVVNKSQSWVFYCREAPVRIYLDPWGNLLCHIGTPARQ